MPQGTIYVRLIRADTTVTATELLKLCLFQIIRIEPDSPAFIQDFIDLACTASAFQIVYNHLALIAEEPLTAFRMR